MEKPKLDSKYPGFDEAVKSHIPRLESIYFRLFALCLENDWSCFDEVPPEVKEKLQKAVESIVADAILDGVKKQVKDLILSNIGSKYE